MTSEQETDAGHMVRLLENESEAANRGGVSCFYYGPVISLTLRSAVR
jgi:hypothetical protein